MIPSPHVRGMYHDLLSRSVELTTFYERVAMLLDLDPNFFPGYLELLWRAEELHDDVAYRDTLRFAYLRATRILTDTTLRQTLIQTWTSEEQDALREVLSRIIHEPSAILVQTTLARILRTTLEELVPHTTQVSPREPRHLKHVDTLDPRPLQAELSALAPFWWHLHSARTMNLTHHQHTRTFLLRRLPTHSESYTPLDGAHESEPTPYASLLMRTHQAVLDFAKNHNLSLGRVAVVRMSAGSQAYRHYDSEPYLQGRDRYHLVLQCGTGNLLSSGPETKEVRSGEFWFFDNKAMHRAYNGANTPRVHVIFDGYPIPRETP